MGNRPVKILSLIAAIAFAAPLHAACVENEVRLAGDFGRIAFDIEVARTPQEQARGLMFVEEMDDFAGMLFVYPSPRNVSFWMRNTLIPLDMIFLDETGTIRKIHKMAVPLDETPIFGGSDIKFVLEVNGGIAGRFGLAVGDVMQHPSIGDLAVYGCDLELN